MCYCLKYIFNFLGYNIIPQAFLGCTQAHLQFWNENWLTLSLYFSDFFIFFGLTIMNNNNSKMLNIFSISNHLVPIILIVRSGESMAFLHEYLCIWDKHKAEESYQTDLEGTPQHQVLTRSADFRLWKYFCRLF